MDACSALRKEKSPLQRLHLGVKKDVLHHRKISTFRPSPLDTSNTSTTSSRVSAAVKIHFDLTNSTGSKASNTKPIRDVSPIPFVNLSPESFSYSQQGSREQRSTKNGFELLQQEIKEISRGQKQLMEIQEKILCSQTVFYGLISDLKDTVSLKCDSKIDACTDDQPEAEVCMNSKDAEEKAKSLLQICIRS